MTLAEPLTARDDAVRRAAALLPLVAAAAAEEEADRRLSPAVVDALTDAGLFRLLVPRRHGGDGASIGTLLDAAAAVARGDGSTGWVVALLGVTTWSVGLFPDAAQAEVFADGPDARVCGVLAPTSSAVREEGGLRVTGRWGWASGCHHAGWAVLGVPIVDASGHQVDQGLALVPMAQLRIEDTWFTAGMRATGSDTLVADGVLVPDHRVLSLSRVLKGDAALVPVLALALVAPITGMVRAALDAVLGSLGSGKGISHTFYEHAVDSGALQSAVADAASRIESAELHLERAARAVDGAAADGAALALVDRARIRMDTAAIGRYCREAVETLLTVNGAGSFAQAHDLQRIWRDISTATRHALINPLIAGEVYGRALLGVPEQVTPLI